MTTHGHTPSLPAVASQRAATDDQPMSTRQALPILLDRQAGRCAGCQVRLIGPGWHPEGQVLEDPCDCGIKHGRAWTIADGYAVGQVNHKMPRMVGRPDRLSNYEAVCGPCNLAHLRDWRSANR